MTPQEPSAAARARSLQSARRVADAVLYEGYVLFPYRASAPKNRYRWQFGVLVPGAQAPFGTGEPAELRSECLVRAAEGATVEVRVRFLRIRHRQVERAEGATWQPVEELEVGGDLATTWDEGVEEEVVAGPLPLAHLATAPHEVALGLSPATGVEELRDGRGVVRGRIRRTLQPIDVLLRVRAERLDDRTLRLTAVVRNTTAWSDPVAARDEVLRRALVGVHLLLVADEASFASVIDPPAWADGHVVDNRHTHPVLAGDRSRDDLMLSLPIILSDHPEVAPESPGDAYDATEIDELLTLAVRALTPEERRHARATDPRAAEVVDRAAALPPEILERLHGATRQLGSATAAAGPEAGPEAAGPGGVPGADRARLDEELQAFLGIGEAPLERISVDGRDLGVGDLVRLRPSRRADAQDLFAAGRLARVARLDRDVDGQTHVAVLLAEDPGADLHRWSSRYLYFTPDEVEPEP